MTTLQPVRGTQSLLGEDADRMAAVTAAFDRVRCLYAFQRVEVPVFEPTEVFARSIGETTDIVSKEMYTFADRGGVSITLRPEFTAGICRAYVSEGWQQHGTLKLATDGPVFRYERPQKGRFRQFNQLDAEIIGAGEPAADVELLALADQLLRELGIADHIRLELNTLGDPETRDAWRAALVEYFSAHRDELSEDCKVRLERNPLRILDSKHPNDRVIAESAPSIDDFLTSEAAAFFSEVTAGLDALGIAWTRNSGLVRGLDYYRHTTFEFVTDQLGAQGAVLAGGRYDGLIEALGGPNTPAVGWAAGVERLAMMLPEPRPPFAKIVIVPDHPELIEEATAIAYNLRRGAIEAVLDQGAVDIAFKGNSKRRVELAKKSGYEAILFLRKTEHVRDRLHLTHVSGDHDRAMDLLMRVLAHLPEPYKSVAGSGPA
jgi:histidyl-tRNA synthetase